MFEIGSAIARIKADTSEFQRGIGEVSGKTNALSGVMTKLGGVIAGAFAVSKIIGFGKQASQEAMDMEKAMISLEIISGKFGVSADTAKTKAVELGKSLRIGVGASAESLQNLLKSGLSIDQATDLMKRFTNEAMTGKSANIDLATAVKNLSFAYATGNSALGNMSGISENWVDITEKGRLALEKEGVAVSKITDEMAKYRGIIDLTNLTMGSAERFTGTLADKQAQLGIAVTDLKVMVGQMLNPVIAFFVDLIAKGVEWVNQLVASFQGTTLESSNLTMAVDFLKNAWEQFLLFIQPALTFFVQTAIPLLQSVWAEIWYFINQVVPPLWAIAKWIFEQIATFVGIFVAYWKENWDHIKLILQGAWELISGIIRMNWAVISGIITVGLKLLTGDWKGAWEAIKKMFNDYWEGLKTAFGGIINFLKGWGGWLLDELTKPFKDAWNKISEIVNKIKDALDFTKRHSPSVVDIVTKGVKLVNKGFDNLKVGIDPIDTNHLAIGGIGTGAGSNGSIINISLDGAFISDEYSARSMAERVGDLIISKLQSNVKL